MFKKFITWLYLFAHKERGGEKGCEQKAAYDHSYTASIGGLYTISPNGYTTKIPDMPASLEGIPVQDIRDAANAINNSRAIHTVHTIDELVRNNYQLKDWEVKIVEEAYSKFAAKYSSPLSKALK